MFGISPSPTSGDRSGCARGWIVATSAGPESVGRASGGHNNAAIVDESMTECSLWPRPCPTRVAFVRVRRVVWLLQARHLVPVRNDVMFFLPVEQHATLVTFHYPFHLELVPGKYVC